MSMCMDPRNRPEHIGAIPAPCSDSRRYAQRSLNNPLVFDMDSTTRNYADLAQDFRSWYPFIAFNMTVDLISVLLDTCLITALLSDMQMLRSQCRNLFYLNVVVSEGICAGFEFIKFALLICSNELLESRSLQYADAVIVHMTALVTLWTLAVVAVDLWLILCKRIKISDRAVVGACASGWIIGTVEAISILLDSTLTWAETLLFAGSSWSSRHPLVLFRTILGWSCVFLSVGATGTAYYLIMRHIAASKASISQTTKSKPTLDSLLIIYMHPYIHNRILSWFKLVRPARAESIATSP
ncbi:hypothetical protein SeMB42_g02988 [Synchytrium endobioticum]|uniref:G-protein coupled receptors family 1 profile domain-containing protein n=1 Tax=Synchytrium endobioticum TaxID=286115 RepID=A0A507DAU9_9FUNG|nr:hypothetical protein SeMB42_g02988 [Synchytrium endobioticum]